MTDVNRMPRRVLVYRVLAVLAPVAAAACFLTAAMLPDGTGMLWILWVLGCVCLVAVVPFAGLAAIHRHRGR